MVITVRTHPNLPRLRVPSAGDHVTAQDVVDAKAYLKEISMGYNSSKCTAEHVADAEVYLRAVTDAYAASTAPAWFQAAVAPIFDRLDSLESKINKNTELLQVCGAICS
ncbi:hypothetical protein AURDEDRAFT_169422 [Auricularia subglabra TFB-10046 SS5]|nr:hypothetical protein AURDEDRAFT_169422 [Auricularia subglabra TFB-10046 SS5]